MSRQKSNAKHIRSIGKTGNVDSPSYFITLPIDVIRKLGWHGSKKVSVRKSGNKIVIEETIEEQS